MTGTEQQISDAKKMVDSFLHWERSAPKKSRDGKGNNTLAQIASRLDTEADRLERNLMRLDQIKNGTTIPSEEERKAGFFQPPNRKALLEFEKKERKIRFTITSKKTSAVNLRETVDNLKHRTPNMNASRVINKCIEISRRITLLDTVGYQDPWRIGAIMPGRSNTRKGIQTATHGSRKAFRGLEL